MPITIFFCLGWGAIALFFAMLVRVGARPAPKPPRLLHRDSSLLTTPRSRPTPMRFALDSNTCVAEGPEHEAVAMIGQKTSTTR